MEKKIDTEKIAEKIYERELVKAVEEDFARRREERKTIEQQWKLNLNYLAGNQYSEISPSGEIREEDKFYGWQSRNVFNHIAPIIDTRLAKLSRVRPVMSVRAASSEEKDLKVASVSSDILNSTYARLGIDKTVSAATIWSETCGTAFYKITWNARGGKKIGLSGEKAVSEGDVEIDVVPPFEIFPDSLYSQSFNDVKSLIHARAMHVDDAYALYGVKLDGDDIDVFTLDKSSIGYNGGYKCKKLSSVLKNHVLIIERYDKPNDSYPNGRVVTVGGGRLLQEGELPYLNGTDGERTFPFVKQNALNQAGSFFGVSLIERLIPLQRSYNAVKNRKYEFMNRVSMGVLNVEDGSVDTDDLEADGLTPGKVIVYRQGSRPPQMMAAGSVPLDFTYEEERLAQEFVKISGTSELSRTSDVSSSAMSGTAIELLIEQDETRLSVTADNIRDAVKDIGKHILRLFKQFAGSERIMRSAGAGKTVKTFYFNSSDVSADDIVFDTENELTRTPAQKKSAIMEMLGAGLLTGADGKLDMRTKGKALEILGYGSLDNGQDILNLHRSKAERENIDMMKKEVFSEDYDDHAVHIEEHTRRLIEFDVEGETDEKLKERLKNHLKEHKLRLIENQTETRG